MSVFRAELAAAFLLTCTVQAAAEAPAAPAAPMHSAAPAAQPVIPQSSVQVEALGAPEPAVGLLDQSNGGLGQGIWTDSSRAAVEELIGRLPLATTAPSVHMLARRLLLTVADPPPGAAPEPFLFARVQKLLGAGLLDDAADLAMKADIPGNTDFQWLRASALLLAGRADDVCGPATNLRLTETTPFWMELRAYCYAAQGNTGALELTRELMHAQGVADKAFDILLDDVVSHHSNNPNGIASPNPLHLYLLRSLRLPVDPSADAELGLPADVVAMRDASDTPAQRIHAAEAPARAGAASPLELTAIADAQNFTPEQIDNATIAAVTLPFLEGQALLRQALARQSDPARKAALLFKALALGGENNEPILSAQLQADGAAAIKPDSSMRNLAPLAATALLAARRPDAAAGWLDALNWNALPDRTYVSAITAMIAVASPDDAARAADAQKALGWLVANANALPATEQVATLAIGVYRALGLPGPETPAPVAPPAATPSAAQAPPSDPPVLPGRRPPPQVRMQIAAGMNDPGRKGEAILAMLDFIGRNGAGDLAPDVTSGFVAALVKMGEPDAARAFALDALLLYQPQTTSP